MISASSAHDLYLEERASRLSCCKRPRPCSEAATLTARMKGMAVAESVLSDKGDAQEGGGGFALPRIRLRD